MLFGWRACGTEGQGEAFVQAGAWILEPLSVVERVASCFRSAPPPLLEEEGHALGQALIAEFPQPLDVDRPCSGTALTAGYGPVDIAQVGKPDRPDQRLE